MSRSASQRLVLLAPAGAMREAVREAAAGLSVAAVESPLEAVAALAMKPARALMAEVDCLAFREAEILSAARAACPQARLVAMAGADGELRLAGLRDLVDERVVGVAEARAAVRRLIEALENSQAVFGLEGRAVESGGVASPVGMTAGGISTPDLLAAAHVSLKRMADRVADESPESLAALLGEALMGVPGIEGAALLMLDEAEAARVLAVVGTGIGVDEALALRRAGGDRLWSSAGRGRWLMPVDLDGKASLGVLVRVAGGVDEASVLDALEPAALLAATRIETARQRAAALRMMTLDADTRLHRRGYFEPYVDALCRGARQRRREVLVVAARLEGGASAENPASAIRDLGQWLAQALKEGRVGRWDDRTAVLAAPARDVRHVQLMQQIVERARAELQQPAAVGVAVYPWDGENAAALVRAALI
jgi:GGDEF domain-containing protein